MPHPLRPLLPRHRLRDFSFLLALALTQAACTQWQSAAWDTARHYVHRSDSVNTAPLRPDLQYLRVTTNGTPALLVLGDLDQDAEGRPVQVWYSAGKEVLRLQNGRLVGLAGTPVEWRNVALPRDLPAWQTIQAPTSYLRSRDEMPGYRIGIHELVQVRPISAPSGTSLLGVDRSTLRWYEETISPAPDSSLVATSAFKPLPPARYAVRIEGGTARAVYGEQCLDADLCIQWQHWPHPAPESLAP